MMMSADSEGAPGDITVEAPEDGCTEQINNLNCFADSDVVTAPSSSSATSIRADSDSAREPVRPPRPRRSYGTGHTGDFGNRSGSIKFVHHRVMMGT
jgi:hypothetical protein